MRRREFIAGLGGAAAWQLAALAQQPGRVRRVGCQAQARVAVLREGLAQLGWTERNVRIEERFAEGDSDLMRAYAAELVGSALDVIVVNSAPALAALQQATRTIPIVFSIVSDPAGQRFVASLGRPSGNITGFSFVDFPMLGKWLETLKEIAPTVKRITLVFNPRQHHITPPSSAISKGQRQHAPPSFRQRRCVTRQISRLPRGGGRFALPMMCRFPWLTGDVARMAS